MTLSLVLKKKTERGPQPIYLRISHKGTRRYIATDVRVHRTKWSTSKRRVRKSHPEARQLNRILSDIMSSAYGAINKMRIDGDVMDAQRARERIAEVLNDPDGTSTSQDFLAFIEDELEQYERRGQVGTHKSYTSVARKFNEFYEREYGRDDLPFALVDARLFRRFRTFCYEVRGNSANTVGKALNVMRTFVRSAMKEGKIDRNDYPFEHITIDSEPVKKDLLRPEEIERMAQAELETSSVTAEVRRWFLWAYYTGGMRFSDVATLQRKHIRRGRVHYRMEKTRKDAGIPISEKAQAILDHYDDRSTEPEAWVFPILDGVDPEDTGAVHSQKESRNAMANDYLNEIAAQVGIEKRVSFHLARNAALWRLYEKTDDIYKVSKIAGHSSVEQTQEYLDGFVDDEMFDAVSGL